MKKITDRLILAFSMLSLSFASFPAFSQDMVIDDLSVETSLITDNNEQKSGSITAKVLSVNVNVDNDKESYIVSCLGRFKNNSHMLLRNIKLKVKLMDFERNLIEEIPISKIDLTNPGQEKAFKMEKYVSTSNSPFEIRAEAEIIEMEKTSFFEIANWFIKGDKETISNWNIEFKPDDFLNDSTRRNAAIRVLYNINKEEQDYEKAKNLVNELRYSDGLKALSLSDHQAALINFSVVDQDRLFGNKAEFLIQKYRFLLMIKHAQKLITQKKYLRAKSLLKGVSADSKYFSAAETELKKIDFLLRAKKPEFSRPNTTGYNEKQIEIINLMEELPRYIIKNAPSKEVDTWIFSDFSRFHFDQEGNLLSFRLYPIYN